MVATTKKRKKRIFTKIHGLIDIHVMRMRANSKRRSNRNDNIPSTLSKAQNTQN